MADLICVKSLHDNCGCPWCRKIKDHLAALEFYRGNWGPGPVFSEPFPEKEER